MPSVLSTEYNAEYAATVAGSATAPVVGHPGYVVNAAGQLFSCRPIGRGGIAPPTDWRPMRLMQWRGRWGCILSFQNAHIHVRMYQVMAAAFLGPCPAEHVPAFRDTSRKWDHSLPNVYYRTKQSIIDAATEGRRVWLLTRRKLSTDDVIAMRNAARSGQRYGALAKMYGCDVKSAKLAIQGLTYKDVDPVCSPVLVRPGTKNGGNKLAIPDLTPEKLERMVNLILGGQRPTLAIKAVMGEHYIRAYRYYDPLCGRVMRLVREKTGEAK